MSENNGDIADTGTPDIPIMSDSEWAEFKDSVLTWVVMALAQICAKYKGELGRMAPDLHQASQTLMANIAHRNEQKELESQGVPDSKES